jgi:RNA polymerase sigma-70 factor (ECF subfamily)
MDESKLIKRILEGEKELFSELVISYQKEVINICNGFLHDIDSAKDVAQEVFIEAWKSLSKFRGDSKFSTWIYRISVNKSLNYLRETKKTSTENISDNELKIADCEKSPEEKEIEINKKLELIHKSIDNLAENQRTAFVLSKFEEISYKEIAETMNLTISSVESLIHRAKTNLQKELSGYYKKN